MVLYSLVFLYMVLILVTIWRGLRFSRCFLRSMEQLISLKKGVFVITEKFNWGFLCYFVYYLILITKYFTCGWIMETLLWTSQSYSHFSILPLYNHIVINQCCDQTHTQQTFTLKSPINTMKKETWNMEYETCRTLSMKTPERHQRHRSNVINVNFNIFYTVF